MHVHSRPKLLSLETNTLNGISVVWTWEPILERSLMKFKLFTEVGQDHHHRNHLGVDHHHHCPTDQVLVDRQCQTDRHHPFQTDQHQQHQEVDHQYLRMYSRNKRFKFSRFLCFCIGDCIFRHVCINLEKKSRELRLLKRFSNNLTACIGLTVIYFEGYHSRVKNKFYHAFLCLKYNQCYLCFFLYILLIF